MVVETKQIERTGIDNAPRRGSEWLPALSPSMEIIRGVSPQGFSAREAEQKTEEGYYGIPILKRPPWRWEIACYFFLEGVSAGAFLLTTLAELFGNENLRPLKRAGRYLAFFTLLPCPPLLIADLGRPERFHHMLRVWKPSSPMNLGAWALSAYSLPVGLGFARALAGDVPGRKNQFPFNLLKAVSRLVPARLADAIGLPFAFIMLGYPGVLLSTTSTPVWSKTRFLGALFACSSIGNGLAALSLAHALGTNQKGRKTLERLEVVARVCEAATLGAYLVTTGTAAKPLTSGRYAKHLWLGAIGAGLVLPALLGFTSKKKKANRAQRVASSLLKLAGGFALKWAVVHAGRESAVDIAATHEATKPSASAPGWGASHDSHNPLSEH